MSPVVAVLAAPPLAEAGLPLGLIAGVLLCYAAAAALFLAVFPPRPKVSMDRRAIPGRERETGLAGITKTATASIESLLRQVRGAPALGTALEEAGVKLRPAEFIIVAAAPTVVVAGFLLAIAGPLPALLVVLVSVFAAKMVLGMLAGRRRAAFNDQLDDSLQLLASGLRAGHSLLRAIDALSVEAEAPTSEEFTRVINETRLGRDLGESLDAAALRMRSEDFEWVAQAIAIHREVGGNLAEVLDQVGQTIRERNQIRRQIKSLSAEGRISALVLMVLPFGIGGFLAVITPSYVGRLFQGPLGYVLLTAAAVLLIAGGLWLRKVITFKF